MNNRRLKSGPTRRKKNDVKTRKRVKKNSTQTDDFLLLLERWTCAWEALILLVFFHAFDNQFAADIAHKHTRAP